MSILEGIGDGGSGGDLYVDSNRWYSEAAFVLITGRRFFLCTRGGEEMWPFARPRPGTASRWGDLPYLIFDVGGKLCSNT